MKLKIGIHWRTFLLGCTAALFATGPAHGSTPAELVEMSLQELLNIPIRGQKTGSRSTFGAEASKWHFGLTYTQLELDGYLDGSDKRSLDDVQFTPPEVRTDRNFPVVPTTIKQSALIFTVRYALDRKTSIDVGIPYIRQSTDHQSVVPGYDTFRITSEGIGDISFNLSRIIKEYENSLLSGTIGISVPTGSINKKGDTPRAPGDQQLPYTMQLGSGTWDMAAGLSYQRELDKFNWGTQLLGKVRFGENDRDYTLGNRASLSAWVKSTHHPWIRPKAKLAFQYWDRIDGEDSALTVPGPFPYPAGITNPNYFGGRKLNATLGVSIGGAGGPLQGHSLDIDIGKPVYQNLNGVQPKEVLHFTVRWSEYF